MESSGPPPHERARVSPNCQSASPSKRAHQSCTDMLASRHLTWSDAGVGVQRPRRRSGLGGQQAPTTAPRARLVRVADPPACSQLSTLRRRRRSCASARGCGPPAQVRVARARIDSPFCRPTYCDRLDTIPLCKCCSQSYRSARAPVHDHSCAPSRGPLTEQPTRSCVKRPH